MKKIEVNGITYEVEKNYKNAFDIETVQSKLTEHFYDYDYILGDIAYNKLRLKGFYNTNSSKKEKWNDIAYLEEYIKNYCAYDCAYFLLKKIK